MLSELTVVVCGCSMQEQRVLSAAPAAFSKLDHWAQAPVHVAVGLVVVVVVVVVVVGRSEVPRGWFFFAVTVTVTVGWGYLAEQKLSAGG